MREWTADGTAELKRLYGTRTNAWLARHFGVGTTDVEAAARVLGLSKSKGVFRGRAMPRWSAEEISVLVTRYPNTSNREIAVTLGRSTKSVGAKASQLGLRKRRSRLRAMGAENVALRRSRRRLG